MKRRSIADLEAVPKELKPAVVSAEDKSIELHAKTATLSVVHASDQVASAPRSPSERIDLVGCLHENPYLQALFCKLGGRFAPLREGPKAALAAIGPHRRIMHIHWEETFLRSSQTLNEAMKAKDRALALLSQFKMRGGRVLWTMHNAFPHEDRFSATNLDLRRGIVELADRVLVHNAASLDILRRQCDHDPDKVRLLPHPSYLGLHDLQPTIGARRRIALLFGKVRAYKKIDGFLEAYVNAGMPFEVTVAGSPNKDDPYADEIESKFGYLRRLRLKLRRIREDELQSLFDPVGCLVLTADGSANSGVVHLGLQSGAIIVAPDTAAFREALPPQGHAFLYRPGDGAGAVRAAQAALATPEDKRRAVVAAYMARAETVHPFRISEALGEIYDEALGSKGLRISTD